MLSPQIRDNSEDLADQTPAATMWNVLLPLLLDFEELLHGYNGELLADNVCEWWNKKMS